MESKKIRKICKRIDILLENISFKLRQINHKYLSYILLTVVLPICLIKFLGVLQPLEYAFYDFWYYINPVESVDERIVIVKWDEDCINKFHQSIISDKTLIEVLEKIERQNPRLIGIDLYRNVSTPSSKLDKIENAEAWSRLSKIFNERDNIIGIEKIIEPKADPHEDLERKERVAAADVSLDSDSIVRKAYVFPKVDLYGSPADAPYIGWALGFNYLVDKGWDLRGIPENEDRIERLEMYQKANQSVSVSFERNERNINNFFHFDPGWSFLINWRKTKLPNNFITVSIADLLDNDLYNSKYKNLFRDRLVIIGNLAISRGDIHQTTLSRWGQKKWTFGAEIVAQTASSVINAAINERNFIRPSSFVLEFFLLYFTVMSIAILANSSSLDNNFSSTKLRLVTALWGLFFSLLLGLIAFASFRLGLWLNIVPALIGICLGWIVINNYCQWRRERDDFNNLVFIMEDLNHNLGNASSHLKSSSKSIVRSGKTIIRLVENDLQINGMPQMQVSESEYGLDLANILSCANSIKSEKDRIDYYRERASKFLQYTYSNRLNIDETVDLNQTVKTTVENLFAQDKYIYQSQIRLSEHYDRSIGTQKIYVEALEILIESLLDNALFAVNPMLNQREQYVPKIKVKTVNLKNSVRIVIEDNGSGIPKQYQKRIFLSRVSFKDGHRGRGIGLYLVSRIVAYWRGSLSLESEIGKGSRFVISLPKLS